MVAQNNAVLVRLVLTEVEANSNYRDTSARGLRTLCLQGYLLIDVCEVVFAIKVSMLARAARCL